LGQKNIGERLKQITSEMDASKCSKMNKDGSIYKDWKELKSKRVASYPFVGRILNETISSGFDTAGYRPSCEKCGERGQQAGQRMHDDDKTFIDTYGPLPALKVPSKEAIRYSGACVRVIGVDQAATARAGVKKNGEAIQMYTCEVVALIAFYPGLAKTNIQPKYVTNRIVGDTITIPADNINCTLADAQDE